MNAEGFYRLCLPGERLRASLAAVTVLSGTAYFTWRITVLNLDAPIFSSIFLLAELFGFCTLLMTAFICWRVPARTSIPPPEGLTVDVFITTYSEPLDVIRTTAIAAVGMRYPHTTWLLDDGNRAEIRALALELGCSYLARGKNVDAKAGNLNYALRHSTGEFIAVFDADHVPEAWFIERLLGYFADPLVALAQAPQDYFTEDAFQFRNDARRRVLWHDQSFFYGVGQAGRDYWNAASFCGTTAILRRQALTEAGGFATETVTEDMHTSVRLQKLGYRSVFHPEPLAYGIAAPDYGEFLQQRWRWGHGNVQTLREERLPFCKGLSWPQRICYSGLGVNYFEGWTRLVLYVTPAAVLIGGLTPIADTRWFFHYFLPYFAFACLLVEELGRGGTRLIVAEEMAMAHFPVYLLAALGLVYKRRRFRITAKQRGASALALWLMPPSVIFGINAAGLSFVALAPTDRLWESLTPGVVAVVCAWAMFHMLIASRVMRAVVHDTFRLELPGRLLPLPVVLESVSGERLYGRSVWLGADAVCIDVPSASANANFASVSLLGPGHRYSTGALVEKRESASRTTARLTLRLSWRGTRARDGWNRTLHSCSWQRALLWPGSHVPTLLERVAALFGRRLRPDPRVAGGWRAVLCVGAARDEPEQLAFLRARSGECARELMEFPGGSGDTLRVYELTDHVVPLVRHLRRYPGDADRSPWPGARITCWREMALAADAEFGKPATGDAVNVAGSRQSHV